MDVGCYISHAIAAILARESKGVLPEGIEINAAIRTGWIAMLDRRRSEISDSRRTLRYCLERLAEVNHARDRELLLDLSEMLSRLDARQSFAIIAHHGLGMTYREIGERLGKSPDATKQYVEYGIAKLRKLYPDYACDATGG